MKFQICLLFLVFLSSCENQIQPQIKQFTITLEEQRKVLLTKLQEKGQSPFDPFTTVVSYDVNGSNGFLDLQLDLTGIEKFFVQQGMQFDFEDFKKFQIQDTPIAFRQPQFKPFWGLFDTITLTYHDKNNKELFEVVCTK